MTLDEIAKGYNKIHEEWKNLESIVRKNCLASGK